MTIVCGDKQASPQDRKNIFPDNGMVKSASVIFIPSTYIDLSSALTV